MSTLPLHKIMVKGGVDMHPRKDINIEIGQNVKREREKAGYTQEEFSELIGMGPKSLSAAERGVVGLSLTSLRKICRILSISSDALIFGECPQNDAQALAARLERLSPTEFQIASNVMQNLLAAFALENHGEKH